MGIGYTIDTPVKVAHFGISSVISLGDDGLIERMRAFYCKQLNLPYTEIDNNTEDYRAKRITAYLNLIDQIVQENFNALKKESFTPGSNLTKYFEILPDSSPLRKDYLAMLKETDASKKEALEKELKNNMEAGSIDVNIMTKLDKDNYTKKGEKMPIEYNDAHAAVRGFAHSTLNSGLVLSAGLSPRLYSYLSKFDCFFPDENGNIKKKIILKVSDYRSSLIQGKFLAKKGLWVTEYRVESGLNCGGHAFATNGFLMGPILDEFKNNREALIKEVHTILNDSLKQQERPIAKQALNLLVTAQGGVGTAKEHNFLLTKYNLDSIGWGTPFLLVPEAVNVDNDTFDKLSSATEDDLYLSNISPIGVPFNSLRGNTKDVEKEEKIAAGKPGSTCPSQYLKLYNTEFTDRPICVASRQYQKLKIEELNKKNLPDAQHQKEFEKITVKSCICAGLVMTPYIEHDMLKSSDGKGISVCPGPNMAYFSKKSTLAEMVSHIYGRINLLNDTYRPNLFVKELSMYVDYLKREINESIDAVNEKKQKYFEEFKDNLISGIEYYKEIIDDMKEESDIYKAKMVEELEKYYYKINDINLPVYQEAIVKG
jgi:hypothetical protein